ncbi:hypothetical protein GLN3_01765 [Geobacillus lituanicus]|nr:hypothetical protein GLN3_01765 [Geobacillus lituanicus]
MISEYNSSVVLSTIVEKRHHQHGSWRDFIVPLAAVVYTVVMGVLSWLRFTYAWDEDRLLVEEGVFVRKRRSIPFERIHGISVTEGIWQRMAGVVQVHVEAAGDALGEAEVTLRAISKEEARCLQRCVEQAKHKVGAAAHPEPSANRPHRALFALSAKEIGVASLTSGGALGVVAALCGFLSQLGDFIPYEALIRDLQSTWNGHGRLLIALFILSLLLAAYGVAIVQNMIRYASFVVRKQEDTIVIARGWLERKAVSVPVDRVQGISTTLPYDMDEEQNLLVVLRQLAESVSARMNEKRVVSRTVQLTIRYYDFQTITRSQTGMDPLWDAEDIFSYAVRLFQKHWDGRPVRLLGVAALHVFDRTGAVKQLDLFHYEKEVKMEPLWKTVEQLQAKFGARALQIGVEPLSSDRQTKEGEER